MTREERAEYNKRWYQANRAKRLEQSKQYYQSHKKDIAEKNQKRKQEKTVYNKQYFQENKEVIGKQQKQYYNTPRGRAIHLLHGYNATDKFYNRIKGDLTAEWIVENIFSRPCVYCGESDWHKIGCNRLDNTKPHTKDNVEPCCFNCNRRLPKK